VGYAEKNEPRTLETPRPNNCPKISGKIVVRFLLKKKKEKKAVFLFPYNDNQTFQPTSCLAPN